MIDRLKSALQRLSIGEYAITDTRERSEQLFFIKKNLDSGRICDSHQYKLRIYNRFSKEGHDFCGMSEIKVFASMSDDELDRTLKDAYRAASFVNNPTFSFPEKTVSPLVEADSDLFSVSLHEICRLMSNALFAEDCCEDAFINSGELFVSEETVRIVTSYGTDVSYRDRKVDGEFVTQCKTPQDVENYQDFHYRNLACDALKEKVRMSLIYTKARACAAAAPTAGNYRVILSGSALKSFFGFYLYKASAGSIYAKYSDFAIGEDVQFGGCDGDGDRLSVVLKADAPFSDEGLRMTDCPLLDKGILKTCHGSIRLCSYLGTKPTGNYQDFDVAPGSTSFEEMKKAPYLHVVNFSDFDMDFFTGHFGGEIRLAYLFDGEKEIPVTGGSVNGCIFDCQRNITLSAETFTDNGYTGPLAISLTDIPVAGAEA